MGNALFELSLSGVIWVTFFGIAVVDSQTSYNFGALGVLAWAIVAIGALYIVGRLVA